MEPAASLTAFTIRPLDTQMRHGIPAFPLRPGYDRARPEPPVSEGAAGAGASGPPSDAASRAPSLRARVRAVPGLGDFLAWLAERPQWFREMAGEAAFWGHRFRHMRRTDLVIVAGSNQLSDYFGGPWGFPYAIWAWTLAARVAGARVAILSVGAGPIRSRRSRFFIRGSVSRAFYVSYRDAGSRDAVAAIGVRGPYTLAPDLAYGLRPRASGAPSPGFASAAPAVLIIPLPHFDPRSWAERDPGVYGRYIDTFATFAVTLLGRGYRVRFAPTQLRVDPPVIADILRAIASRSSSAPPASELAPPVATFQDLVARLAESDYVVATRFHGVLISQMLGKPTIGIVYRPSMRGQLVDVGQGAYAIDIADVTAERLLERLQALVQDRGAGERIERRLEEYRAALAAQIRAVLAAGPELDRRG